MDRCIERCGYHGWKVPGVPLAGCVLRPGRAINCEPLSVREGGREEPSIVAALPGMHI